MVEIRKPNKNECAQCAELITISGRGMFEYIFAGLQNEIIHMFYDKKGTFYSCENILVYAEDEAVCGLILAYPVSDESFMAKRMLRAIREMYKITHFKGFMKIMGRMKLNRYFPEKSDDELFIANLAVFKEFRGQGIGLALLKTIEKEAAEKGLTKLSLYVETDNDNAKRIYEKFGFYETHKVDLPDSFKKHGIHGFYKMVKMIQTS